MSTRATVSSVSSIPALSASNTSSLAQQIGFFALLVICGMLAAGAFLSFPLYDDGWLALVLRESGPHFLAQHIGDRPVFGFLVEQAASFGSANRIVFVGLNAILWLILAIETGILFRKLFPEFRNYSVVAAGLTLAPIVLQTQLATVLVAIPANGAAILGYAALLVLLPQSEIDRPNQAWQRLGIASVFAGCAVGLSEYGVATNLVGAVILAGIAFASSSRILRRQLLISAAWLFTLTVAAYLLFAKIADFSVRPDVAPTQLAKRGVGKLAEIPFDVISGTWHAVIGGYAAAFGNFVLAWDSKSTIIGLLFGLFVGSLIYMGIQGSQNGVAPEDRSEPFSLRVLICFAAIFAGLVPFSVMGRPTTLLDFGSRFRIPIMPVAAAITVALSLTLVRRSLRWIPVVMFGFIIGYASWTFTYTAMQQSRAIASLRSALEPAVSGAEGYTVAVVPFSRFESELTANIASTWPVEVEKKLWAISEGTAQIQFGSRSNCHSTETLDIHMRGLARAGKLEQILWVDARPGKPISVEPYCYATN